MRGVRAFRQAPLVFLVALLVTCDFSLKFEQPAVELDVEAAFVSSKTFEISYRFITEEPVLRCRYTVSEGNQEILSNVSGQLTPGVLYTETINIPEAYGDGNYLLDLVGQVKRGGSFVDMASLSQTVEFSIDTSPPLAPGIGDYDDYRFLVTDLISLDHKEWPDPVGSPVKLSYNFDADPLEPGATEVLPQVGEVWIAFPSSIVSTGLHTLQAIAIDEAGNYQLPCVIRQFSFLKIESAINLSADPHENSAKVGTVPSIEIRGFTFSTSDLVKLYDFDGTEVPYFASPIIGSDSITVTFDLRTEGGIPDIDPGPGYIRVTTTDPNVTTTTTPFIILAP